MDTKSEKTPVQTQGQGGNPPVAITPELVRQVADRVYAALLNDLKIEFERNPLRKGKPYVRR